MVEKGETSRTAEKKTEFGEQQLKKNDFDFQLHGMSRPKDQCDEVIWQSGQGSLLKDVNGQEYVDGIGGLFCNHIGHGRKEMAQAAYDQMSQLEFMATLAGYSNPNSIRLTEKIVKIARKAFPEMSSVFLTSGGSEANEAAYHFVLRYFSNKGMKDKTRMVSFCNSYHGSTMLPMSANTTISSYGVERVTGGKSDNFVHIDFPNPNFFPMSDVKHEESLGQAAARKLEEAIVKNGGEQKIACFLFEPIQGDGGAVIPHDDFYPLARQICDKYNILMIADEVMTGFGKTGKWFAMEHWGVHPDIITFAKGVSSGYLPVGGVILSNKVKGGVFEESSDEPFKHDYTYASHATCCAVALKNLEIMEEENLVSVCAEKGYKFLSMLMDRLLELPIVKDVRGAGLLIGIELKEKCAKDVESKMLKEEHVVVHAAMNEKVIDLAPSFVTTQEQFERIADGLYNVLSKM